MTLSETKRMFIQEWYGTEKEYRKARKDDYYKVQFNWTCFMDDLLKIGLITEEQWQNATF